MMSFRDAPIRSKLTLITTGTAAIAVLTACAGLLVQELQSFRSSREAALESLAEVIGTNSRAALSFHDPASATDVLAGVQSQLHVETACLFDAGDELFARFERPGVELGCAASVPIEVTRAQQERRYTHLGVTQPVTLDGERIGTLVLRAELRELRSQVVEHLALTVAVMVGGMLAALFFASRLQRFVSEPVADLVQTAERVSREKDFSLRVDKHGSDELGAVIDAFNQMLARLERRDRELGIHRERLEDLVAERTEALRLLHRATGAANAAHSVDEAIATTLELVCRYAQLPIGHAYARDPERPDVWLPTPAWYLEDPRAHGPYRDATADRQMTAAEGVVAEVLATGTPASTTQAEFDPGLVEADLLGRLSLCAALVLPVRVGGETVGLLVFHGARLPRGPEEFDGLTGLLAQLGVQLGRVVERQRSAAAVRKSESNYRMLMEQASDAIIILGRDGRIVAINSAGCTMFGLGRSEAVGKPFDELVPEDERSSRPIRFDDLQWGRAKLEERRLNRQDGSSVFCEISTKGFPDGRFQAIVRDITDRKRFEEKLRQTQKMQAVGQLAAGIAHEINNPMAFVRANLGLLRREWSSLGADLDKLAAPADVRERLADCEELIDESLEGVDRTVAIVRDVKEFSHPHGDQREPTNLNEVIDGVLRVASHKLSGGLEVVRDMGELPDVSASPSQLQQVFLNLVMNAVEAVSGQGRIRIATGRDGSGHVVASVEDDGCGMAAEQAQRIFEPFFTTKRVGEGTGLGLSISYEIVRLHGGDISVDSTEGVGATFRVRLPAIPESGPS